MRRWVLAVIMLAFFIVTTQAQDLDCSGRGGYECHADGSVTSTDVLILPAEIPFPIDGGYLGGNAGDVIVFDQNGAYAVIDFTDLPIQLQPWQTPPLPADCMRSIATIFSMGPGDNIQDNCANPPTNCSYEQIAYDAESNALTGIVNRYYYNMICTVNGEQKIVAVFNSDSPNPTLPFLKTVPPFGADCLAGGLTDQNPLTLSHKEQCWGYLFNGITPAVVVRTVHDDDGDGSDVEDYVDFFFYEAAAPYTKLAVVTCSFNNATHSVVPLEQCR